MDNEEALFIASLLHCDQEDVVPLIKSFAGNADHYKRRLVLETYLRRKEVPVHQHELDDEAAKLYSIFPCIGRDNIRVMLDDVAVEENRVHIVTRKLLKMYGHFSSKRPAADVLEKAEKQKTATVVRATPYKPTLEDKKLIAHMSPVVVLQLDEAVNALVVPNAKSEKDSNTNNLENNTIADMEPVKLNMHEDDNPLGSFNDSLSSVINTNTNLKNTVDESSLQKNIATCEKSKESNSVEHDCFLPRSLGKTTECLSMEASDRDINPSDTTNATLKEESNKNSLKSKSAVGTTAQKNLLASIVDAIFSDTATKQMEHVFFESDNDSFDTTNARRKKKSNRNSFKKNEVADEHSKSSSSYMIADHFSISSDTSTTESYSSESLSSDIDINPFTSFKKKYKKTLFKENASTDVGSNEFDASNSTITDDFSGSSGENLFAARLIKEMKRSYLKKNSDADMKSKKPKLFNSMMNANLPTSSREPAGSLSFEDASSSHMNLGSFITTDGTFNKQFHVNNTKDNTATGTDPKKLCLPVSMLEDELSGSSEERIDDFIKKTADDTAPNKISDLFRCRSRQENANESNSYSYGFLFDKSKLTRRIPIKSKPSTIVSHESEEANYYVNPSTSRGASPLNNRHSKQERFLSHLSLNHLHNEGENAFADSKEDRARWNCSLPKGGALDFFSTDSSDDSTEENYLHVHHHDFIGEMQSMFSNIPKDAVENICTQYGVEKGKRPPLQSINIIVNTLLRIPHDTMRNASTNTSNVTSMQVVDDRLKISFEGTDNSSSSNTTTTTDYLPYKQITPVLLHDSDDDRTSDFENVQFMETPSEVPTPEVRQQANDDKLVYQLMEMFPEACPDFIRRICAGKHHAPGTLDSLITEILNHGDYPKRRQVTDDTTLDSGEQLELFKQILPDADPSYLEMHCNRLMDKPDELKIFISNMIEQKTYPTMRDYLRQQQMSAQQKQYTTEFNIETFVEIFPDPIAYFEDPNRKGAIVDENSEHYAMFFFRNLFPRISVRTIRLTLSNYTRSFMKTYNELKEMPAASYMKSKRPEAMMPQIIQNIPLLQEIAFIKHRASIEEYLTFKKMEAEVEKQKAKELGELQTCSCCFDDEVMPKDMYKCDSGCSFCKECIRKGAEVAFGDGKLDFPCLNNCPSQFSLQTLQVVLNPKMFSKLAMKKQVEEVKAAGLEDLEQCPFCDFVTIPAKDDKVFRCMNPECMKESCRSCKEPSHIPYRCDQVEKEDDVRIRTFIENQMTEALLRKCYKCGLKFIKSEGCNKMTCSCGALMCYVCNQPVQDYKHFNGPGGDQFNLCPLYSDIYNLHEKEVLEGAEKAKKEVGVDKEPAKLKIDPTADIAQHYESLKSRNPAPHPYNAFPGLPHRQDHHIMMMRIQQHGHRRHQQQIAAGRHPRELEGIRFEILNRRRRTHTRRRRAAEHELEGAHRRG